MIVLASASPQRKKLMEKCGYDFKIFPADVEEIFDPLLAPDLIAKHLSYIKALDVSKKFPENLIIGSDTIVVLDSVIYGKPKDRLDAFSMLKKFSGRKHSVITGVTIIYKKKEEIFYDESIVHFRELSDTEINEYLDTLEYQNKAGSYAIQGYAKKFIESYHGSLDNIVGLPTEILAKRMEKYGY